MRAVAGAAIAGAVAMLATPRAADACTPWGNAIYEPTSNAADATPPTAPQILRFGMVYIPDAPDDQQCGAGGTITINVAAVDDVTPTDQLGYQITTNDVSFLYFTRPFARPLGEQLYVRFGADTRSFVANLELRAVDASGNIGEPTIVPIELTRPPDEPDDDGGCATTRGSGWLLALGLAMLVGRRRSASIRARR